MKKRKKNRMSHKTRIPHKKECQIKQYVIPPEKINKVSNLKFANGDILNVEMLKGISECRISYYESNNLNPSQISLKPGMVEYQNRYENIPNIYLDWNDLILFKRCFRGCFSQD